MAKTREAPAVTNGEFDAAERRADFPLILQGEVAYLDNAATTQKPEAVLRALDSFYRNDNSNVHRGVHRLSERATADFERARERVRSFLNAADTREIVFTRGTTESINLVASSFGALRVREGDEILLTQLEHHSNIVPWQLLCERCGAKLVVCPIDDSGDVVQEEFARLFTERTRLAAIAHVSNALGTVNPVAEMIRVAHARGVPVLVDGAQAVAHEPVDVTALDCDFYAFSGHKIYGPMGIGVLYGKAGLLDAMPPYHGGGDMIRSVSFSKTTYNELPFKFEAGTPNVAGAIGLGVALEYLEGVGRAAAARWVAELLSRLVSTLEGTEGVRLVGTPRKRAGAVSFLLEGVHPHDVGTILDREGVAVRTGHHCAQPVMERYKIPATTRASLALYNTESDIEALAAGLRRVREVFS